MSESSHLKLGLPVVQCFAWTGGLTIVKRPISDGVGKKNGGVDGKGRIDKVCLSHL